MRDDLMVFYSVFPMAGLWDQMRVDCSVLLMVDETGLTTAKH
jgi:hypothetical protein